jgi:hypothetical protein
MNPLSYLFEFVSSLRDETELLEACDWDEDRLAHVKEIFNNTLSSLLSEQKDIINPNDIIKLLSVKLCDTIEEKEAETCLHILDRNLKTFLESNIGVDYEN